VSPQPLAPLLLQKLVASTWARSWPPNKKLEVKSTVEKGTAMAESRLAFAAGFFIVSCSFSS